MEEYAGVAKTHEGRARFGQNLWRALSSGQSREGEGRSNSNYKGTEELELRYLGFFGFLFSKCTLIYIYNKRRITLTLLPLIVGVKLNYYH